MIVTSGTHTSAQVKVRARHIAQQLGWHYVDRQGQTMYSMREKYGENEFFVYFNDCVRYLKHGLPPVTYHPSMAFIRAKRILSGAADGMITVSGAKLGDEVLDCTAGLGGDAFVFAVSVGEAGKVTALESELPLFALVREGLQLYKSDVEQLTRAMRRIVLKHSHHLHFLQNLPDRSVDIVYFDPMFRCPFINSTALDPVRIIANHQRLTYAAIVEAGRVARKCVVMKERRHSEEFARLGFTRILTSGTKLAYGVIDIGSNDRTE